MKYIIIEKFGPGRDKWDDYAQWAGLENCQSYYSIDGINRKSLFEPKSAEDWGNCVNKDFKTHIITNIDFAKKVVVRFPDGEIVGVIENPKYSKEEIPTNHTLLGFDIIGGHCNVSLLTNWGGTEDGLKNIKFNKYALVDDINYAYKLKEMLRQDYSNDDHAKKCEVWAIYKINV